MTKIGECINLKTAISRVFKIKKTKEIKMAYKIIKLPENGGVDNGDGLDWYILYGLLDPAKPASLSALTEKLAVGISVKEIKSALYLNYHIIAEEEEIEAALQRLERQGKIKRRSKNLKRQQKERLIVNAYPSW